MENNECKICEFCDGDGVIIKHQKGCVNIDDTWCDIAGCEEYPCPYCSNQTQDQIPDWGWWD